MHILNNWNFWLSLITAVTAILAIVLSIKQISLSNKHHLFERRLKAYMIVSELVGLYEENRMLIEGKRKDEPQFAIDHEFIWLTNNTYMEAQSEAIVHPLEQPYHKEFLKKREELRSLATEIRLIFKKPINDSYGKFVECYEKTLFRMYQYQIIIDKMMKENEKKPMTPEELQKFFPEKEHRTRMYDAMEELKVSYQALVDQKADEKITKYIRL
ncbi:MAG TPA: hypothetical protein IAB61_12700 [Candidatus Merdisoma merdipullorum]|nr:hypothetical protein [Candidatus Merdisoma merdipullorum]